MSSFESMKARVELADLQKAAKNLIVESRLEMTLNSLGDFLFLQYCNSKDRKAFCNKIK